MYFRALKISITHLIPKTMSLPITPLSGRLRPSICKNCVFVEIFGSKQGTSQKSRPWPSGKPAYDEAFVACVFGFAPHSVAENSPIGTVEIFYAENDAEPFSLTYSDNKMDKLILPIPDHGGPVAYDNENLLFRKVSPGKFELLIGSQNDKKDWMKKSGKIGASFAMKSGRKWGYSDEQSIGAFRFGLLRGKWQFDEIE